MCRVIAIANQKGGVGKTTNTTDLLKRLEEYKPLEKVEELEEGNYNMIDGILNNEKPKSVHEKSEERISIKEKLAEKKAALAHDGKQQNPDKGQRENGNKVHIGEITIGK